MNSTWLSRKIKGPNAEGDPVKKKNGKGVKPYQAVDMADYNKRQKMYSDSLDAHLLTKYFEENLISKTTIVPANTPSLTISNTYYDKYASQTKMKPSRIVSSNNKTEREFPLYDKPKQKVILPSLEKMPIGKLKSKSTTPKKLESRQNMKMYKQTVMGTSGKREPAYQYKKRKGLSDEQMYRSFPGLKPDKTK
jgi:hypothetical protein